MVVWVLIAVLIIDIFCVWVVNRNAMKNKARTQTLGLYISGGGTIFAILLAVIMNKSIFSPVASLFGCINGISYAVGYIIIVLYCLKVGPTGPTVTIYSLGVVWSILIGIIMDWQVSKPSFLTIIGIILSILTIITVMKNNKKEDKSINKKWINLVIIGFLFSGISYITLLFATKFDNGNGLAFTVAMNATSFTLMLIIAGVKKTLSPTKKELISGIVIAILNILAAPVLFAVTTKIPSYITFPIISAGPIVLILLLSHYIYKDKLNIYGWISCVLGIVGVVFLNL